MYYLSYIRPTKRKNSHSNNLGFRKGRAKTTAVLGLDQTILVVRKTRAKLHYFSFLILKTLPASFDHSLAEL